MATGTAAIGNYTASDTTTAMAAVRRFFMRLAIFIERYKDEFADMRISSYRLPELPLLVAVPQTVQMRLLLQL